MKTTSCIVEIFSPPESSIILVLWEQTNAKKLRRWESYWTKALNIDFATFSQ